MKKSPMNYVGGKYKLLEQILPLFPKNINTFVDMFAGGANVAINVNADNVVINDKLTQLIGMYSWFDSFATEDILATVDGLVEKYELSKTNLGGYLKLRYDYNIDPTPDKLYTLVCYGFNNQIRFNKKDEFNIPFGKDRSSFNPAMRKNLISFCNTLHSGNFEFTDYDFRDFPLNSLDLDDFVYCDPPYFNTPATYNTGWSEVEEQKLYEVLNALNRMSIRFALSNVMEHNGKENPYLKEFSKNYHVHHLNANYTNCSYHKKDKHNKSDEVLVVNYEI